MATKFDVPDFPCSRRVPWCSRRHGFGNIEGTLGNTDPLMFPCSPPREGTREQGVSHER